MNIIAIILTGIPSWLPTTINNVNRYMVLNVINEEGSEYIFIID